MRHYFKLYFKWTTEIVQLFCTLFLALIPGLSSLRSAEWTLSGFCHLSDRPCIDFLLISQQWRFMSSPAPSLSVDKWLSNIRDIIFIQNIQYAIKKRFRSDILSGRAKWGFVEWHFFRFLICVLSPPSKRPELSSRPMKDLHRSFRNFCKNPHQALVLYSKHFNLINKSKRSRTCSLRFMFGTF